MALTENGGGGNMVMPVGPMYGGGNYGSGYGNGFGGDGWWILLLFILLANGGWGNGNGFGGWGGGNELYPWMNQSNQVNDGFQNQMLNDNITSIRDGVTGLSTQLCNSTSAVQMSLANRFAGVEQGANTRQIATMSQGFNNVQSQLAQCCCDNRLASADLKYTIATENCADRAALSDGIRDVIANSTAQTQAILDKLCQLELDGYKRENDTLRTQLTAANFRESQTAQNALITQGFANEVDQLYNRLNSCPVPTTPVYGRTPIFTCNQNTGCGCGCNM